ncbi:hypothetical protein OAF54_02875 [bacterium]|nr:hypothetical protein [bacterium]
MKIHGQKIHGLNVEVVVIPRQSGDIVFRAQAVMGYDDHDKLNPMPKPPVKLLPGGVTQQNIEDPRYKDALDEWATRKFYYMFIKSLEATDGLEWETVKLDDPSTWGSYKKELEDSGFAPGEVARIEMCVSDACGLNQTKIDEATKRFLAGQGQAQEKSSTQSTEQSSTPSGEPVNAGA